jgi:hypothetical protein
MKCWITDFESAEGGGGSRKRGIDEKLIQIIRREPEGKKPLEYLGTDGTIVLKYIRNTYGGKLWTRFI